METSLVDSALNELVDRAEAAMVSSMAPVDCPSIHRFVPGCYCRETLLPAGTLLTSKIHKTKHFYFILSGNGLVWNNGISEPYTAPHIGITEPGTRRIIFAETDTRWATTHVHDSQDLEEIEHDIIEKHDNPILNSMKEKQLCRG